MSSLYTLGELLCKEIEERMEEGLGSLAKSWAVVGGENVECGADADVSWLHAIRRIRSSRQCCCIA